MSTTRINPLSYQGMQAISQVNSEVEAEDNSEFPRRILRPHFTEEDSFTVPARVDKEIVIEGCENYDSDTVWFIEEEDSGILITDSYRAAPGIAVVHLRAADNTGTYTLRARNLDVVSESSIELKVVRIEEENFDVVLGNGILLSATNPLDHIVLSGINLDLSYLELEFDLYLGYVSTITRPQPYIGIIPSSRLPGDAPEWGDYIPGLSTTFFDAGMTLGTIFSTAGFPPSQVRRDSHRLWTGSVPNYVSNDLTAYSNLYTPINRPYKLVIENGQQRLYRSGQLLMTAAVADDLTDHHIELRAGNYCRIENIKMRRYL